MCAKFAVMFTILKSVIQITVSLRERHLRIFRIHGIAPLAELAKTASWKNKFSIKNQADQFQVCPVFFIKIPFRGNQFKGVDL